MSSHDIILAPSILAGDHSDLAESCQLVSDSDLGWIHLDIMDGHFVPNLTFGPQTLADLRPDSKLFFDTHLMLDEPHRYVEAFAKAGADLISIHVEPEYPISETLSKIKELGCQNGIVINPDTPAEHLEPYLSAVDLVLLMTVQPGFGGQSFRHDVLEKIAKVNHWRQQHGYHYRIEVDGGINLETARLCVDQGVDTLVAGTAFYRAPAPKAFAKAIKAIRQGDS